MTNAPLGAPAEEHIFKRDHCKNQKGPLGIYSDGKGPVPENPVLRTQYELDATACLGERNKADLSGVTLTGGGFSGIIAAQNRANAADTVQRGCMAEKGYLLVPEDQAVQKQAELAAIAEEKRKQEAAAAAAQSTPPKSLKPMAKPAPPPA